MSTPVRVTIADDHEVVRRTFRQILSAESDIEVVGDAADGVAALEQARRLRPDVVLADIRMPGRDGLELTRLLAGPQVADPLRVVIVTTFGQDDYVYAALRNGAAGFLLKRSSPALLAEGVRAAVNGTMLISPQLTVRLLRHLTPTTTQPTTPTPLTDRELTIARLVARAYTNIEIAAELFITPGTVKTHIANIQRKLGARNRVQIATWAWDTDNT